MTQQSQKPTTVIQIYTHTSQSKDEIVKCVKNTGLLLLLLLLEQFRG